LCCRISYGDGRLCHGCCFFFFKQKTAYEIGLGIPAEPLFRSEDGYSSRISLRGRSAASLRQNCVTVFSFSKNHFSSPSGRWSIRSEERRVGKECRARGRGYR